MKTIKPLILDLGAAFVTVECAPLFEDACAVALYPQRKIIIDPERTGGDNITATLLHEALHHLDDLYLDSWLSKKHHDRLNVLANVIDLLFKRNWETMKELYEAKRQ